MRKKCMAFSLLAFIAIIFAGFIILLSFSNFKLKHVIDTKWKMFHDVIKSDDLLELNEKYDGLIGFDISDALMLVSKTGNAEYTAISDFKYDITEYSFEAMGVYDYAWEVNKTFVPSGYRDYLFVNSQGKVVGNTFWENYCNN